METRETKELTVGELVAKDFRKAEIFKKYGIDFCCGGKKSVEKVCREKGIDLGKLEAELSRLDSSSVPPSQNFDNWELDFLADYIVNTHHRYILQSIPNLLAWAEKVARVHGDANPETKEIYKLFLLAVDELNRHMMKEEQVLFPYIRQMVARARSGAKLDQPPFGSVENPVRMMEHEHDSVGEIFHTISGLSGNYNPPEYACNTYRVLYSKLNEFEDDLHQHIHLENNVLFPKAIELERSILRA
ncbi:MAG: iron-sulfur cluster repair di-iron protein [Bacteroidota bacterium]